MHHITHTIVVKCLNHSENRLKTWHVNVESTRFLLDSSKIWGQEERLFQVNLILPSNITSYFQLITAHTIPKSKIIFISNETEHYHSVKHEFKAEKSADNFFSKVNISSHGAVDLWPISLPIESRNISRPLVRNVSPITRISLQVSLGVRGSIIQL